MTTWQQRMVTGTLVLSLGFLGACAPEAPRQEAQSDRYTSPVIEGEAAAINLEAVEAAFFNSKGQDFASWMSAFETRVNEIYTGEGLVSIDAERANDRLVVQGYIEENQHEGFQGEDRKLFALEQTGPATQDAMPYRVTDGQGAVYNAGTHALLANSFLQSFLLFGMFSWAGSYFTPRNRLVALDDHRSRYRQTPAYRTQQVANRNFANRYRVGADGRYRSRTGFDNRRPAAGNQPNNARQRSNPWAGRRTGGGGGMPRRSWGGRRR